MIQFSANAQFSVEPQKKQGASHVIVDDLWETAPCQQSEIALSAFCVWMMLNQDGIYLRE
ncbi:hypothetical protein GCM10010916_37080 [Paenibacillus abyssi]|uniref:Uncharacterized protein n=1 Tax=Paenibacillus abyssi TaxID=1340531 RepID=A0A917LF47_9BACL|nr:hypothetical protein GCM10010916_37080 [Paenibacillus abyssi]